MTNLEARLGRGSNSLNALRLVLAITVIVSHSWPLGGYGHQPTFGAASPGTWAVFGFFVISGYLITSSRFHTDTMSYLKRRLLRIFPGFLVCLVVTVVAFAPIDYYRAHHTLSGYASANLSPAGYVLGNITLKMNAYSVAQTPADVPFKGAWDGSLWTLYPEFVCYLIVGVAACWVIFRKRPIVVVSVFVLATAGQLTSDRVLVYAQNSDFEAVLSFAPFFLAGAVLYVLRESVPCRATTAGLSLLVAAAVPLLLPDRCTVLCALPLAYLILYLGAVLPLHRVGSRNDISYGIYIYGFPVAQMLSVLRFNRHNQVLYIAASIICTVPLAAASWFLVERPAMRRGRRPRGATRTAAPPSVAAQDPAPALLVTTPPSSSTHDSRAHDEGIQALLP